MPKVELKKRKKAASDPLEERAQALSDHRYRMDAFRRQNMETLDAWEELREQEEALKSQVRQLALENAEKYGQGGHMLKCVGTVKVVLRRMQSVDGFLLLRKKPNLLSLLQDVRFSINQREASRLVAAGVLSPAELDSATTLTSRVEFPGALEEV